jgi:hypothetical protein
MEDHCSVLHGQMMMLSRVSHVKGSMKQSRMPVSTWQGGTEPASPHARRLSAHDRHDNASVQKMFDSHISCMHTFTSSEDVQC